MPQLELISTRILRLWLLQSKCTEVSVYTGYPCPAVLSSQTRCKLSFSVQISCLQVLSYVLSTMTLSASSDTLFTCFPSQSLKHHSKSSQTGPSYCERVHRATGPISRRADCETELAAPNEPRLKRRDLSAVALPTTTKLITHAVRLSCGERGFRAASPLIG